MKFRTFSAIALAATLTIACQNSTAPTQEQATDLTSQTVDNIEAEPTTPSYTFTVQGVEHTMTLEEILKKEKEDEEWGYYFTTEVIDNGEVSSSNSNLKSLVRAYETYAIKIAKEALKKTEEELKETLKDFEQAKKEADEATQKADEATQKADEATQKADAAKKNADMIKKMTKKNN